MAIVVAGGARAVHKLKRPNCYAKSSPGRVQ